MPAQSSTYKSVQPNRFWIDYVDGTGASGDYFSDVFTIGGVAVHDLQMGLASHISSGIGVLGVGFSSNMPNKRSYPNIMDRMVSQGLISLKAYSLQLEGGDSPSGSILFGGLDTSKFSGTLQRISFRPDRYGRYTSFMVDISGLSATVNGATSQVVTSGNAVRGVLDSGSTLTYLPDTIAQSLVDQLETYTDGRYTYINCDSQSTPTHATFLTFTLGAKATIMIPLSSLILDLLSPAALAELPLSSIPFKRVCVCGIQRLDSITATGGHGVEHALLGQTFLRSAYVVYNLEGREAGIAQASRDAPFLSLGADADEKEPGEIVELGRDGATTLPAVTGVATQVPMATLSEGGMVTATTELDGWEYISPGHRSQSDRPVRSVPLGALVLAVGTAILLG
jgi:hypothetical protein